MFRSESMDRSCVLRMHGGARTSGARASFASTARMAGSLLSVVLLVVLLQPAQSWACACGCGVFEVGSSSLFPSGSGGIAFLEYDYLNQNTNWHGTSSAPGDDNSDKKIQTQFWTAGLNYMFNRDWGLMVRIPYWDRNFWTDVGDGDVQKFNTKSLGDIRVEGMYTGFSEDMSTGLTFGVKLPTGDYTAPNFDRDTQIGTGSTDVILGAYHLGAIDKDGAWTYFAQGMFEFAVATRAATDQATGISMDYRPGNEADASLGVAYNFGQVGFLSKLALLGQVKGIQRWRDTGAAAFNTDTGGTRIFLAPAVEADIDQFRFYAEVGRPVYQRMNGNQLVAPITLKLLVGYNF